MSEMVVHFPWLHPKLGQGSLPESVVFFDPGVDMDTATPRWRSVDLPLSPAEVRAMLRSYMEFGVRFPRVTDMRAYQATGIDNFYTDTTMDIKSQLTGMEEVAQALEGEGVVRSAGLHVAEALGGGLDLPLRVG